MAQPVLPGDLTATSTAILSTAIAVNLGPKTKTEIHHGLQPGKFWKRSTLFHTGQAQSQNMALGGRFWISQQT